MIARTRMLFAVPALVLAAVALPVHAQGHHGGGGFHGGGGYHGGGGWHGGGRGWGPGFFWGGVGLGIGIGLAPWYYPYGGYPGYIVADAPPTVIYDQTTAPPPQQQQRSSAPDPVIYPRNGQSAQQTEADRQECNRWATTQPQAMADASVFQRAVAACLDGRGYTVR